MPAENRTSTSSKRIGVKILPKISFKWDGRCAKKREAAKKTTEKTTARICWAEIGPREMDCAGAVAKDIIENAMLAVRGMARSGPMHK